MRLIKASPEYRCPLCSAANDEIFVWNDLLKAPVCLLCEFELSLSLAPRRQPNSIPRPTPLSLFEKIEELTGLTYPECQVLWLEKTIKGIDRMLQAESCENVYQEAMLAAGIDRDAWKAGLEWYHETFCDEVDGLLQEIWDGIDRSIPVDVDYLCPLCANDPDGFFVWGIILEQPVCLDCSHRISGILERSAPPDIPAEANLLERLIAGTGMSFEDARGIYLRRERERKFRGLLESSEREEEK